MLDILTCVPSPSLQHPLNFGVYNYGSTMSILYALSMRTCHLVQLSYTSILGPLLLENKKCCLRVSVIAWQCNKDGNKGE